MAELSKTDVHRGSGIIKYKGEKIGRADEVYFAFQEVGFKHTPEEEEHSCYGTINGQLDRLDLIAEINPPDPNRITIKALVEGKEIVIEDVELIDDIPKSGKLEEMEFHGRI